MKLLRANGCRPTASPIASPIATERAKATASSQNVTRSAAGSPRVSNSVGNDATTREGGLTNIGSTHQRAATSQKKEQENDDARAGDPRPLHCMGCHHRRRLPRASSAETSVLRMAAIATTNAI